MAKQKSFLKGISVDTASRKHTCQHNSAHQISKGDKRLKLAVDRTQEYFCVACALASIERDIQKLEAIKNELQSSLLCN